MTKRETIHLLDQQIIDDSQAMIELTHRAAAGENVTRDIKQLEAAIEVKVAVSGGLRKGQK